MKNNPCSCECNLRNCVRSLKKIQDFNGIWTCDLMIPVWCSNQLSYIYDVTDVGSWLIMCSYVPVKMMSVLNVYILVYEIIKFIWEPRKWNQMKNDPGSCERNLCNCIRNQKKKIQDFFFSGFLCFYRKLMLSNLVVVLKFFQASLAIA